MGWDWTRWDGMGWDGMDGMGWDGWDGMDGMGRSTKVSFNFCHFKIY